MRSLRVKAGVDVNDARLLVLSVNDARQELASVDLEIIGLKHKLALRHIKITSRLSLAGFCLGKPQKPALSGVKIKKKPVWVVFGSE